MMLGYRPFLDPLPMSGSGLWLLLLVPLVILVAVAYKTIKLADLRDLPRQAAVLAAQIFLFMAAAAALLWFITTWL